VLHWLGGSIARFPPRPPRRRATSQWQALGARTYDTYCSGCHQRSGRGIAGGFPPLAGHAPQLLAQKGSAYMARLVLFGLSGPSRSRARHTMALMPAWSSLRDDEIAAVIDHVLTTWGNDQHLPKEFKPFVPSEIAAARAENLTSEQLYAMRGRAQLHASKGVQPVRRSRRRSRARRRRPTRTIVSIATARTSTMASSAVRRSRARPSPATWTRHVGGALRFMKAKNAARPSRPAHDETYADLIAYILGENGFKPDGKELPADVNAQQAMSLKNS